MFQDSRKKRPGETGRFHIVPKALLQGVPAAAAAGRKSNPSFPAACTSEMTPLTKDSPTLLGIPENHFMVFWERRSSGGNEHPG